MVIIFLLQLSLLDNKMHIRPAKDDDLPKLASIGAAAFASDLIYSHFYPLRNIYPDDFCTSMLNSLRRLLVTPGGLIMVAELSEDEILQGVGKASGVAHAKTKIVAYLTLVRFGSKESIAAWNPDSEEKRM
jgi:hypothetical protein